MAARAEPFDGVALEPGLAELVGPGAASALELAARLLAVVVAAATRTVLRVDCHGVI